MPKKNITFNYFKVNEVYYDGNDKEIKFRPFSLEKILSFLLKKDYQKIKKPYKQENARLQTIKYDEKNHLWELQFLRLRNIFSAGLADDEGDFESLVLGDGKYLGEFISALYDPETNIMVLHRNQNSLPPSGVEIFLSDIFKDITIKLVPIISNEDVRKKLQNKYYRNLNMKVCIGNMDLKNSPKHLSIVSSLSGLDAFNSNIITLEIAIGRGKKNESIDASELNATLDFLQSSNGVEKLVVRYKDTPDTKVEVVDLLEGKVKDISPVDVDKDDPLHHEKVYAILINNYLERKRNNRLYV